MKKWNTPLIVELDIQETAFGWSDTKPGPAGPGHLGPVGPGQGGPGHVGPVGPHHPVPGEGVGPIPGVLPGDVETDGLS